MNQFSVAKTSFRIYKTNDARTIIESPWREIESVLEIKDNGLSVGSKQLLSQPHPPLTLPSFNRPRRTDSNFKFCNPLYSGCYGNSGRFRAVVWYGALAIDDGNLIIITNMPLKLNVGKYLLVITARTLAATLQNHKIWRITGGLAIPIGGST